MKPYKKIINQKLFSHKVLEDEVIITEIAEGIKRKLNSNTIIYMKLIYFLLFIFGMLFTGYMFMNDFSFDNITFSNYLINTLFILLLSGLAIVGIAYLISLRRRSTNKDIMTIRQYYEYKSAR